MQRQDVKITYIKTALIVGSVFLLFAAWLWWALVINNNQSIFETALSNSLRTTSVTKTTNQEFQAGSLSQEAQAQFGSSNIVNVKTVVTRGENDTETKVETETIATPSQSYSRYVSIEAPSSGATDFSEIIDVWGLQIQDEGGDLVFYEAAFGMVLFGNLPQNLRAELIRFMNEKAVYTPNYDDVSTEVIDGVKVKTYSVTINTKGYVELLKKYDEMLGLGVTRNLNPDDYAGAPSLQAKISIDPVSRLVKRIEYVDDNRQETFAAYGVKRQLQVPENPISRTELEQKLQQVLK